MTWVRGPNLEHLELRLMVVTLLTAAFLSAGCGNGIPPGQEALPYDVLITGGTVVDGTGAERFAADVAVAGDRIVRVAPEGLPPDSAREVLDASGLIVAPGFIDQHAHVQTVLDDHPLAENFLRQGITTLLASLHSGSQPYPLGAYADSMERNGISPNVGYFAGHTWARSRVIGESDRPPTDEELEEMRQLVREAMEDGALGLSTGLVYVPGSYAETEEIIALARVASEYGGLYVSHMRDEATGLLESVRELIRIADEADLPGQVQHHKAVGVTQWGWSTKSLPLIDSARAEGLDIKLDFYPYTASSTTSRVLFPQWALSGGMDSLAARVRDPETRSRLEAGIREIFIHERAGNDLSRVQFRTVPAMPEYNGLTMADLARDRGLPNNVDTGVQLAIELQLDGGFSAIYHAMHEDDLQRIMRHEMAMVCTDGDLVGYGQGYPHPRSYGAFPRVLGRYVRDEGVLTLEEAVRKMTSLAADQIGQTERGRVEEGSYADLTIFDPDQVADKSEFTDPHRYPVGIVHVLVNGQIVIEDGSLTGRKPGRVLTGPARTYQGE